MKKSLIALMLTAVCALTLTGCFQSPQAEPKQPETKTEVKDEVVLPPAETITTENVYKSTKYGYAFTLPKSWGKVTPKEEGNNNLIFTSEDSKKTLKLYNIAIGPTNDAPIKLIITTEKSYQVYRDTYDAEINIRESQGEDVSAQKTIEKELNTIDATFYLIDDNGNKIEEGGGGVAADESADNYPSSLQDDKYGFRMVIPAEWKGATVDDVPPGDDLYITSKEDSNRTIRIMPIDTASKSLLANDTSIEWLGQNSKNAFYYTKSEMTAEDVEILKTFKAIEPTE